MSKLQVTPASAWRPETEMLQLPTQRVIEVREVDLIAVVTNSEEGDVPDFLSGAVMGMMNGRVTDPMKEAQDAQGVFGLVDLVVRSAVVSPQVVKSGANYDKGEINLSDLNTVEKFAIFNVCMPMDQAGAALSFRNRIEAANVEHLHDGEDNGDAAQPDTGDNE